MYGYTDQDTLRADVRALKSALEQAVVQLPSGRELRVSVSAGIAWYPENSRNLTTLRKYADFAMYQVKHSHKGKLQEFAPAVYRADLLESHCREEFHRLINEELITYRFQPIINTNTGSSGAFALDDYGSGYSNERSLLELSPNYIKIDLSIIRSIDTDANKRQIVSNTVSYAHQRGIRVVAEGLATADEVRTVLPLGVDLLQGFFLAVPQAEPGCASEESLAVTAEMHGQSGGSQISMLGGDKMQSRPPVKRVVLTAFLWRCLTSSCRRGTRAGACPP